MTIHFLQLILGIIFVIGLIKDSFLFKRIGYIILIAIPIGSTNNILSHLDIITLGEQGINFIHWIVGFTFLSFMYDWYKEKKGVSKADMCVFLFLMSLIMISIVIGILNDYNFISDSQKYLMIFLWAVCFYFLRFKYDYYVYLKDTILGLFINIFITCIINIFPAQFTFLMLENIVTSSRETGFLTYISNAFVFPILLSIFIISNKNNFSSRFKKIVHVTSVLSLSYYLFFTSNRTVFIVLIFSVFVSVILSEFFLNLSFSTKIKFIISSILIMFISMMILDGIGSETIDRLTETNVSNITTVIEGSTDTIVTRLYTLMFYLPLIFVSPFGYGFGRIIPLINQYGRFHGTSNFTDNAFINVGMKLGLIGMVIFIVFVIWGSLKLFIHFIKSRKNYYLLQFLFFTGFILTSALMTGQIMNNYPISFFFVTYCIAVFNYKSEIDVFNLN